MALTTNPLLALQLKMGTAELLLSSVTELAFNGAIFILTCI
jgi:hypothetical protein